MTLHIGYEQVEPFDPTRRDEPDTKARAAGQMPKALLKSDPAAGRSTLDTGTTLRGVLSEAWVYMQGNRCAIDWVLDQHKEKVIDLLQRVAGASVQTQPRTEAGGAARR